MLSDPSWDGGRGERCFVNDIGAAGDYLPADLDEEFFEADIVALGGTALVPGLHEGLPGILARARARGALTMVNTVFDFRAERRDGVGPWPLGGPARTPGAGPGPLEAYRACDLLVMDKEEALRLSGLSDLGAALGLLRKMRSRRLRGDARGRERPRLGREGTIRAYGPAGAAGQRAGGPARLPRRYDRMRRRLRRRHHRRPRPADEGGGGVAVGLDLGDALSWGIAAGAFTLGFLGGTYYETRSGEKRELVSSFRDDWLSQVGGA